MAPCRRPGCISSSPPRLSPLVAPLSRTKPRMKMQEWKKGSPELLSLKSRACSQQGEPSDLPSSPACWYFTQSHVCRHAHGTYSHQVEPCDVLSGEAAVLAGGRTGKSGREGSGRRPELQLRWLGRQPMSATDALGEHVQTPHLLRASDSEPRAH